MKIGVIADVLNKVRLSRWTSVGALLFRECRRCTLRMFVRVCGAGLRWQRDSRCSVLLRQLQARAIWTPVLAKHVCPEVYQSDVCAVCGRDRATMVHVLWECQETDPLMDTLPPRLASAVASTDCNLQREAVQLALAALERQRPNTLPPPPGGRRQ